MILAAAIATTNSHGWSVYFWWDALIAIRVALGRVALESGQLFVWHWWRLAFAKRGVSAS